MNFQYSTRILRAAVMYIRTAIARKNYPDNRSPPPHRNSNGHERPTLLLLTEARTAVVRKKYPGNRLPLLTEARSTAGCCEGGQSPQAGEAERQLLPASS